MFYSVFKNLSEKLCKITVELKNDIEITGNLKDIDNNLNISLTNISVNDISTYPQFLNMTSCFIRGNTIRYIYFNKNDVDYQLIEEACKKQNKDS
jgi:U6 snRNA-associated Sm-like protein LSm2